ncbi:MAG: AMP-binding protein [Myxococcales bacterium]
MYTFLEDGESNARSLTSAELDRHARSVAAALQARFAPGSRLVLALPPGLDYVVSFWSCLYAGVCAVPLYPPMNPKHVGRMISVMRDCDAAGVITLGAFAGIMGSWLSAQGTDPTQYQWLSIDGIARDEFAAWTRPALEPESIAFLQYTSGSTGEPKGVMLSHRALTYNSKVIYEAYEQVFETAKQPLGKVSVSWLPPYHDLGLIDGVLQPALAGKHAVLMSPLAFLEKPARWLKAITKYRGTTSGGPCFGYDLCERKVSEADLAELDLSSWYCSYNAAEPIRREVVERFTAKFERCGYQRHAFTPVYGLAEASLMVTGDCKFGNNYWVALDRDKQSEAVVVRGPSNKTDYALVSLGHARGDTKLRVVNPETMRPCAPREIGEAWISGSSLAHGYWGKPELNAAVFSAFTRDADGAQLEGPFFRTGDLGFLTEDGTFFISGRLKDLIILRGKNHYPQDIEASAQHGHASLRGGGGAAFSVQGADGEALVLVQEVRANVPPESWPDILRAAERAIVENHGVTPHDIVLIAHNGLPKTSSGKIRRFKAREKYLDGSMTILASSRGSRETESAEREKRLRKVERKMVAWIAEHADLELQAVGRDTDFAEFGIDSVAVVELICEVEEVVGFRDRRRRSVAMPDGGPTAGLPRDRCGARGSEPG